jgi:hypothetical protein
VSDGWTVPKEMPGVVGSDERAGAGDEPSDWACRVTDTMCVIAGTPDAGRLVGKAVDRPAEGEGTVLVVGLLVAGVLGTGEEMGGA